MGTETIAEYALLACSRLPQKTDQDGERADFKFTDGQELFLWYAVDPAKE